MVGGHGMVRLAYFTSWSLLAKSGEVGCRKVCHPCDITCDVASNPASNLAIDPVSSFRGTLGSRRFVYIQNHNNY